MERGKTSGRADDNLELGAEEIHPDAPSKPCFVFFFRRVLLITLGGRVIEN